MNTPPPWGKKKRPSAPEDFIDDLMQKFRALFDERDRREEPEPPQEEGGDPGSSANALAGAGKIALALLLLAVLRGSFYTVEPEQQGIVLRFGKYHRTALPGLNVKIPFAEKMLLVDVTTVRKEEFGFRTRVPGQNSVFDKKGYDSESLMLTGDKNVIDAAWIVQYKVSDPVKFLFKVSDVKQAVRDNSETVIRRIVGNMDFDYVLGNRITLADMARIELQRDLDRLESGVEIVTLQLLDITPTDTVKPAFNEVNEADQDMKRLVNEAEETYNRVIPKARGSAKQLIEEARGYAAERINEAKGGTARFSALAEEYGKAKEITRRRLHLEAMRKILPKVKQVYVLDSAKQSPLPLLNLNSAPAAPAEAKHPSQ